MIAFASDRNGGSDIDIMSADGGEATRLTYNSAAEIPPRIHPPDGKSVVYSASIQDAPSALLFPAAWQTELYSVPVKGRPSAPDSLDSSRSHQLSARQQIVYLR